MNLSGSRRSAKVRIPFPVLDAVVQPQLFEEPENTQRARVVEVVDFDADAATVA
jgi:hypothetical protein